MTIRTPQPRSAPEHRERRREVERVLAEHGLWRGPGMGRPAVAADDASGLGAKLRPALERLGPVFSSFGLYLASRADLLDVVDRLELAAISERGAALAPDAVARLLANELGRPSDEIFSELEPVPRQARLVWQEHAAHLAGGVPVLVRVARPDREEWMERDLPLLLLLEPLLLTAGWTRGQLTAVADDFAVTLFAAADFGREAEGLAALAAETDGFGPLAAPQIYSEFTTPRLLVRQDLRECELESAVPDDAQGRAELSRRIGWAWLRLALRGRVLPVEPRAANLAVLSGGRVAFTAGPFDDPTPAAQSELWKYLLAAVQHDAESTAAHLVPLLTHETPAAARDQLFLRLRQVVPFRDARGGDEGLSDELLLHWRLAHETGFRPRPHLLAFYRGLAALADVTRRVAPGYDAMRQAVEDGRLLLTLQQLGETLSLRQLGSNAERYAAVLADLPQRLDAALTRAAGQQPEPRAEPAPAAQRGGWAGALPLLLAMGALALLARQLDAGTSVERLGAVLFLLCGALLLRLAGRT